MSLDMLYENINEKLTRNMQFIKMNLDARNGLLDSFDTLGDLDDLLVVGFVSKEPIVIRATDLLRALNRTNNTLYEKSTSDFILLNDNEVYEAVMNLTEQEEVQDNSQEECQGEECQEVEHDTNEFNSVFDMLPSDLETENETPYEILEDDKEPEIEYVSDDYVPPTEVPVDLSTTQEECDGCEDCTCHEEQEEEYWKDPCDAKDEEIERLNRKLDEEVERLNRELDELIKKHTRDTLDTNFETNTEQLGS